MARITEAPLSLDEHVTAVTGPAQGAIASFIGTVRDHDPSVDGRVTHLDYSAHPDAQSTIKRIAAEVCGDDAGELTAAVSHRIGLLGVGEAAIVAAVSSAHRAEAFDTCRLLVERIKAELPVWKREVLADGSHTWVGIS
ncbi:molybdenum cofactor biosynthesis protein MoaE [Demequina aurantiaca]|uniref:molybdenum cofactor biosynthesis protein MoaE n=1 Tax=Demequina aurantiaca TaxID=676200 RepID=UPI000781D4AB|nr:molybdenum cofactor biosynthesis protein MoaE [Demequina aurantiaca]